MVEAIEAHAGEMEMKYDNSPVAAEDADDRYKSEDDRC